MFDLVVYQKVKVGDVVVANRDHGELVEGEKYKVSKVKSAFEWCHKCGSLPGNIFTRGTADPACKGCGELVDAQVLTLEGLKNEYHSCFFFLEMVVSREAVKAIRELG